MRLIHVCAALTGAAAFALLAAAHHLAAHDPDFSFVILAAIAQTSAAVACLALAQRSGRLAAVAAFMILIGANLFAAAIYASTFFDEHPFHMLAPIGGGLLILGWLLLAFAKPDPR